jgi:predicted RNA-binding Zn-ribbon protein involved in translation (DUF1610 family)
VGIYNRPLTTEQHKGKQAKGIAMCDTVWKFDCPVCGEHIVTEYSAKEISIDYIGATIDCPVCDILLKINTDLTCVDFGEELAKNYAEYGLNVSEEEASGTYIEIER